MAVLSTPTASIDIANDGVTNLKLANVNTATIKGRVTAATGDPEDLTPAQARAVIASDSGGGATNFFRADGAWAAPPGGGGGIDQATADGLYINIDRRHDDRDPSTQGQHFIAATA